MNEVSENQSPESCSLRILFIASEMHPFAKVGGLGDVVASLSAALRRRGHDARVVLPRYGLIDPPKYRASVRIEPMGVWMGNVEEWCSVYEAQSSASVPVYFIEHKLHYERRGIYHDDAMNDYEDNPRRFAFLCRAALQLCKDMNFSPDIVHTNDWQSSLASAYLKEWHWNDPQLAKAASLLTIHNAAYQGVYPKTHYDYIGLGGANFTSDRIESRGRINLLKAGIYYSDSLVAVSPSFAREITQPSGGFGLETFFRRRAADLTGILNGIDYSLWDPASDTKLPAQFSSSDLQGKKACKRELQEALGLAVDDKVALIGTIGRFVEQKGFHLIAEVIDAVLGDMAVQFVILGQGAFHIEDFFRKLPGRFGGRAGSYIGFNDRLAHLINAGSDFFLMPSQWEPCGLNQMFAQRYGTLPIVRAVGGLDDTVRNYDGATGEGTGFKFNDFTARALYNTIGWAISTWYDRPAHIRKMIDSAMRQDYSWEASAARYEEAYRQALANKRKYDEGMKKYYW